MESLEPKEADCMWRKAFDQGARRPEFGFVDCTDNQALLINIGQDPGGESFELDNSKDLSYSS
jgi:hypothetical protein